jgi:hypothetical protein
MAHCGAADRRGCELRIGQHRRSQRQPQRRRPPPREDQYAEPDRSGLNDRYNNDPGAGLKNGDTLFVTGISVKID